jgi:hypothetical protein
MRHSPESPFVTEGEATFNFCVTTTKSGEYLKVLFFLFDVRDMYVLTARFKPGHKVLVVDAGGLELSISVLTP